MIKLETERLYIYSASIEEMRAIIEKEAIPELRQAYGEMLSGCVNNPEQYLWYCIWQIQLKTSGALIGNLSFKGMDADGIIEIGYGIEGEYENQGYATEAVESVVDWAILQPGVTRIEAETEADNLASQRVLQKVGFVASGRMGEEGPRFVYCK